MANAPCFADLFSTNVSLANQSQYPLIVGVGGFTSEVGKTTLLCDLLRAFPAWEAIKTTRGHYRSCGKDPGSCCVSHLLEDEAVIRSGRELTYTHSKDTGRYWDAGATNVHWLIATDAQIEGGIRKTLGRVRAGGVFVEGNSFTKFVEPNYFVMVLRPDDLRIKRTAREALGRVSAFYLSGDATNEEKKSLRAWLADANLGIPSSSRPIFVHSELSALIASILEAGSSFAGELAATCAQPAGIIGVLPSVRSSLGTAEFPGGMQPKKRPRPD